ncbi:MAG: AAA family ATPase, partial [Minicystis sp.]
KTYSTVRRALELILGPDKLQGLSEKGLTALFREHKARGQIEFVTFHQAYGYEEFIEGIRPVLDQGADAEVRYELHDGVFKRIALRAAAEGLRPETAEPGKTEAMAPRARVLHAINNKRGGTTSFAFSTKTPQYVLIIDEINRGNMSKILGELMTLLEKDKRLTGTSELTLPLSYSPGQHFGVPPNLHILGTMNTADRSIALMDVALRRRFTFEELMPDPGILREELRARVPSKPFIDLVVEVFESLNDRIRFLYDRDHQLGHSYFLEAENAEALRLVFVDRVIPMLQEYFYGAWDKICTVLGCPYSAEGEPRRGGAHLVDKAGTKTYLWPLVSARTFLEKETLGFDHEDYEDRVDHFVSPKFQRGGLSEEELYRTFLSILVLDAATFQTRLDALLQASSPSTESP